MQILQIALSARNSPVVNPDRPGAAPLLSREDVSEATPEEPMRAGELPMYP